LLYFTKKWIKNINEDMEAGKYISRKQWLLCMTEPCGDGYSSSLIIIYLMMEESERRRMARRTALPVMRPIRMAA